MRRFFPLDSGALCMTHADRNIVEVVATWGEGPVCECVFAADSCWALREGRPYQVNDPRSSVGCAHVAGALESARLCVPMMSEMQARCRP